MKTFIIFTLAFSLSWLAQAADDSVTSDETQQGEVSTTHSKSAQELPQVLYVVPWKEMDNSKNAEQKLVLHDFFGDLYDPVLPSTKDAISNN